MTAQPRSVRLSLPALLLALEAAFLALYFRFVAYDDDLDARLQTNATVPRQNSLYLDYLFFTDVQVMIFVGFGCLLSFLRLYGFSGLAFSFLAGVVSVQWAVLAQGYFRFWRDGAIRLSVANLLNAEFACAVVLISFGAVLGKTSPVQLLVMALLEVPAFALTEWAVLEHLRIVDTGGSILIHLFGCYFGLGVTFALYRPGLRDGHAKEGSGYQSDMLSVLGTLFLWVFWPSFNGALAHRGDDQHRAVLHTFIGLSASTMTAFALSSLFDRRGRFSMADVQNVTLAGGVTVGASVDMMISPAAAFALGALGGVACMLGYRYLGPFLARRCRIQDQCGIHNLHGLTGLISSLAGICAILAASEETYGPSLYQTLEHRAPPEGDPRLHSLRAAVPGLRAGLGRSAREQALWQAAAVGVAVATAAVGGVLTGLVMKLPFLAPPPDECCYDDEPYFVLPSDHGGSRAPVDDHDDLKA